LLFKFERNILQSNDDNINFIRSSIARAKAMQQTETIVRKEYSMKETIRFYLFHRALCKEVNYNMQQTEAILRKQYSMKEIRFGFIYFITGKL